MFTDFWGNHEQFEAQRKLHPDFNHVMMNLAAHSDETRSEYLKSGGKHPVRFQNWKDQMESAVRLASLLGERLVIVGHSTGGLLGIYSALTSPDKVHGLVLIEPSFQVNALKALGVCLLGWAVPSIHSVKPIIPEVPSTGSGATSMGCEVTELSYDLMENFGGFRWNPKAFWPPWGEPNFLFSTG